jgi:hypothetical protein
MGGGGDQALSVNLKAPSEIMDFSFSNVLRKFIATRDCHLASKLQSFIRSFTRERLSVGGGMG